MKIGVRVDSKENEGENVMLNHARPFRIVPLWGGRGTGPLGRTKREVYKQPYPQIASADKKKKRLKKIGWTSSLSKASLERPRRDRDEGE